MTRPRPSVGPALAGAVDLSALKQPPPSTRESSSSGAPVGLDITEANLEAEVLARSNQVPVVVLLWTPRSEASAQLGDALAALASADGGTWALTTVNVDTAPRVAQVFGVQAVPTVVAVAGGQPISSFEGVQPPEQLRRWIDSLLSATAGKLAGAADEAEGEEAVDPELERARALWDDGEFDDATTAYQAILDAQPAHAEAKDALRQIAFLKRATTRPADSVATAAAAPDDIEAAFAAADVEVALDSVDDAFNRLIALVRRTAGDDRATVRTRLVELFELFPQDDPRVIAGRRNLANALY